jgi:hypothetical protein
MGAGIGHLNIVSDAGAVRCRVVGTEHIHFWPQTERGFDRDLDEVGGPFGRLAGAIERVGAGDVEVTWGRPWVPPASRSMISVISFEDP